MNLHERQAHRMAEASGIPVKGEKVLANIELEATLEDAEPVLELPEHTGEVPKQRKGKNASQSR